MYWSLESYSFPFATSFNLRQFFNVIDGYVFLAILAFNWFTCFEITVKKNVQCNLKIQGESVELVIYRNFILVSKFKV